MPVGCYKQMSPIKEGVIMRLQCILYMCVCDHLALAKVDTIYLLTY